MISPVINSMDLSRVIPDPASYNNFLRVVTNRTKKLLRVIYGFLRAVYGWLRVVASGLRYLRIVTSYLRKKSIRRQS